MLRSTVLALFIGLCGWLASPALAADGRFEINQAVVDAAGGFPFVISAPGSYVLTGDLAVATDVGAIAINILGDVTIDLNGFRIEGSSTCVLGSCGQGAAIGLSGPAFFGFGSNIAVHGGQISKFSGSCIMLGSLARVEGMHVAQCGRNGIFVGGGGSVTGNLVISTGENGILLDTGSVYSHNSVRFPDLAGTGGLAIRGGRATAGNFCDDGGCGWVDTRRRFYLTPPEHLAAGAPTACDAGFHMASLWEILDPTQLRYDVGKGVTTEDSGLGPPTASGGGWIRTGKPSNTANSFPGGRSCGGYTSSDPGTFGTIVTLQVAWETSASGSPDSRAPWWGGFRVDCSTPKRVWCVEN